MADAPDRDQQTEAPTPKRRKDAADEGDVLISKELAAALMMVVGIAWLAFAGHWLTNAAIVMLRRGLIVDARSFEQFDPAEHGWLLVKPMLIPIGFLLATTLLVAVAGPALLGSLGWRSKAIVPKANRLNPLKGLQRMFGLTGALELAKAVAKAGMLGAIGWWMLDRELAQLLGLTATQPAAAISQLGGSLLRLLIALAAGMVLIALIDVPAQMLQRTRRLRMSREQIKEEMRQSDGAPELKAQLRARQQAILNQSARRAMADANVVLNNPTHFSVALRYRPGLDVAPVVVARGRGDVAMAMRELASERAVPMLEHPQLTRAIYFSARTGQAIPEDLYQAVAIILAFIFRLDREFGAKQPVPHVDIPSSRRFDSEGNIEKD